MTNDWKKEINTKLYELLSQYERDLVASGLKVDDSELNYEHLSMHRKSIVEVVETIIQSLLDKQIEEIEKMGCLNEFVLPNIYKKTGLVRKSDVLTKLKEL